MDEKLIGIWFSILLLSNLNKWKTISSGLASPYQSRWEYLKWNCIWSHKQCEKKNFGRILHHSSSHAESHTKCSNKSYTAGIHEHYRRNRAYMYRWKQNKELHWNSRAQFADIQHLSQQGIKFIIQAVPGFKFPQHHHFWSDPNFCNSSNS